MVELARLKEMLGKELDRIVETEARKLFNDRSTRPTQ